MLSYPREQAPPGAQPVSIKIDYGQPHLRGRTLHVDSLVPYDAPWRLGANASTTLTTGVDLVLGGTALAKGTYILYALPGRNGWKLIVQKDAGQQPGQYNAAHDVARIDVGVETLPLTVESLLIWLVPSTEPGPAKGMLNIAWGTSYLTVPWSVKP